MRLLEWPIDAADLPCQGCEWKLGVGCKCQERGPTYAALPWDKLAQMLTVKYNASETQC